MIEATNKGSIEVISTANTLIIKGNFSDESDPPEIKTVELSLFGIIELIQDLKRDKSDKVIQIDQTNFHIGKKSGIQDNDIGIQFPAKGAWEHNLLTVPFEELINELADKLADSLKHFE